MSVEAELVQACRFLDVISNELHDLNKNIKKYLDAIEPKHVYERRETTPITVDGPPRMECASCFSEINYRGGEPLIPVRLRDVTRYYCTPCGLPEGD